jgi:hypothetical protein
MNWNSYFEMMIDWKQLPAYKAEPRIDSLIGYYLKDILNDVLSIKIDGLIPEFPLRLGTLYSEQNNTKYADRSYKVDFWAVGTDKKNYLIEFKTDNGSINDKQMDYLKTSANIGTEGLINGVKTIEKASRSKDKYKHLTNKLKEYGLIDDKGNFSGKNPKIELILIAPDVKNQGIKSINFEQLAKWFYSKAEKGSFEESFGGALAKWYKDYKA